MWPHTDNSASNMVRKKLINQMFEIEMLGFLYKENYAFMFRVELCTYLNNKVARFSWVFASETGFFSILSRPLLNTKTSETENPD